MKNAVLKLDPQDNVLIALKNLRRGEQILFENQTYTLTSDVAAKHKFAQTNLAIGGAVIRYGGLIGKARQPIRAGEALTTLNTAHEATPYHEKSADYLWASPNADRWRGKHFLGYKRRDGQVGTRNYWLVVPLVFCENRNVDVMKQAFEEELGFASPKVYHQQIGELVRRYRDGSLNDAQADSVEDAVRPHARAKVFEHVDGIKFLIHEGGCGGTREDTNNLCSLIAGYVHHPNVAGATVLSLGCQHSQA